MFVLNGVVFVVVAAIVAVVVNVAADDGFVVK